MSTTPTRRALLVRRALVLLTTVLLVLGAALPAMAHVTVRTDNASAGGFAVYTIRVPNERDDSGTTQVEVQVPEGLEASRHRPAPGWDITIEDGVITITGGTIGPDQFQEFQFQARNPEEPGTLAFPAIQTYESGEVVEWTGAEDGDTPAPLVELVAAAEGGAHGGGHGAGAGATEGETEMAEGTGAGADGSDEPADDDAGTDGSTAGSGEEEPELVADTAATSSALPVIALVLSILAVALGGLAVVRAGRP